jgi:glycosyltransferase involved in cell wall biosynthesis
MDRIVVINDLSQPKGGASAIALLGAKLASEQGFKVTLLTGDDGAGPELARSGIDVVALGGSRLLSSGLMQAALGGLYNHSAARLVSSWIEANDTPATVYHLHGWAQILSPSIFDVLRPVSNRTVISAHDFFLVCPNGSFSIFSSGRVCELKPLSLACVVCNCDRRHYGHKLWRVARQAVQRRFFRPAESPLVLAVHDRMRPFLTRSGIPDASIITLRNPARPFTENPIDPAVGHEVLYVGRLEETKGPDLALAAVRSAGGIMRLIGDGSMRHALQSAYPEMVFMGYQPPATIAHWVAQARMLVMPSRYPEPFGLVAVEAMWSGLPIIVAHTALLAEEIVQAGAGFSCDVRDVAAIAKAVETLLRDKVLARTMGSNAARRTTSLASTPEDWIKQLIAIYQRQLTPQVLTFSARPVSHVNGKFGA